MKTCCPPGRILQCLSLFLFNVKKKSLLIRYKCHYCSVHASRFSTSKVCSRFLYFFCVFFCYFLGFASSSQLGGSWLVMESWGLLKENATMRWKHSISPSFPTTPHAFLSTAGSDNHRRLPNDWSWEQLHVFFVSTVRITQHLPVMPFRSDLHECEHTEPDSHKMGHFMLITRAPPPSLKMLSARTLAGWMSEISILKSLAQG